MLGTSAGETDFVIQVNFGLEVLEAERPRGILSRLSKDFHSSGKWTLTRRSVTWRRRCVRSSARPQLGDAAQPVEDPASTLGAEG